ncbi:MAG: DUF4340 domain-containing protein [Proteobacteria bacterium]|nr:DUF4340 domain-containing protein [Pseudomonadota bacterium]
MTKKIVLAGVFLLGAVGLVFYERNYAKKQQEKEDNERTPLTANVSSSDVKEFTLSFLPNGDGQEGAGQEGETTTTQRLSIKGSYSKSDEADSTGSWQIIQPLVFPGDTSKIQTLLDAFLEYRYDQAITLADEQRADFGLEVQKARSLTLTTFLEDPLLKSLVYRVGNDAPVGFKLYLESTAKPGYVLYGPRASAMSKQYKVEDFLDLSIEAITLESGKTVELKIFQKLEEKTTNPRQPSFHERFLFSQGTSQNNKPATLADEMQKVEEQAENSADEKKTEKKTLADLVEDDSASSSKLVEQLTFEQHPDKKPSLEAVENLLSSLTTITPSTWVQAKERADNIRSQAAHISISLFDQDNLIRNITIYHEGDMNYVEKQGHLFEFKSDIKNYFATTLDDLTQKRLPLDISKESLSHVKVTSHEYENGKTNTYILHEDAWILSKDDAAKQESSSSESNETSETTDNKQDTTVTTIKEAVFDNSPLLKEDITDFIDDIYDLDYQQKTKALPDDDKLVHLYSITLQGPDGKEQAWRVFTSYDQDGDTWLNVEGTKEYYKYDTAIIKGFEGLSKNEQEGTSPDQEALVPTEAPANIIEDSLKTKPEGPKTKENPDK